ncbi:type II toxin-antitoxin system RelE/ParE family toxin [Ekhidna sp.]|uniref:type II toxin-antitoxin system RelE/ParE family toxin n=1 Tax=Ekhidna sp. TaxID=2608089 RepID=UPI003C7BF559
MVEKVVWTQTAYSQKLEIFEYWNQRNGSTGFSQSLENDINSAIDLLKKFPRLGIKTQLEDVRVKIIKNYLLIYKTTKNTLYIRYFGTLDKTQKI